jgi:hypothetical protein
LWKQKWLKQIQIKKECYCKTNSSASSFSLHGIGRQQLKKQKERKKKNTNSAYEQCHIELDAIN